MLATFMLKIIFLDRKEMLNCHSVSQNSFSKYGYKNGGAL